MKIVDIKKWNRKKYYEYYKNYDNPCFSVDLNIDIDLLIRIVKTKNLKFFPTFIYCLMKAMNDINEFKYRVRGDTVILHDFIHPSFTVLNETDNYVFCYSEYVEDFHVFYENVLENIKKALNSDNLEDEPGKDDLVFISSLPWFSFNSVTHPFSKDDPHSIPRISFGKYFLENSIYKLPLSIQIHHGLCDGLHIARLIDGINQSVKALESI